MNILLNSPDSGLNKVNKSVEESFKHFIKSHNISYIIVARGKSAYHTGNNNFHPYKSYRNILGVLNVKPVKLYGVVLYRLSNVSQ